MGFAKYFREKYKDTDLFLVDEDSPYMDHISRPHSLDSGETNELYFQNFIQEGEKISTFKYIGVTLGVFSMTDGNKEERILTKEEEQYIVGDVVFEYDGKGIIIDSSWNTPHFFSGLYRKYFTDVLLQEFESIQSSHSNNRYSKAFWLKILEYALQNNHRFVVVNSKTREETEITSKSQMDIMEDEVWAVVGGFDYRLKIYK